MRWIVETFEMVDEMMDFLEIKMMMKVITNNHL
jgi:hypothetical protein